ncbi:5-oxoprolinase subunit PxpB [Pedobacter sp. KBS0701]|uniref:5-oxoprolinase subunit PxpB n=1 Tax=unclassified Pedobacter TaxID=2628915 RepID=UPI00110D4CE1|nr:5-oxoprolinase subunit PxpB [Pedobacter sp. KBS0701]QDW24990.1 5-oxoprolinase subunit PxpB [Pedobacter sp. KBS0701]
MNEQLGYFGTKIPLKIYGLSEKSVTITFGTAIDNDLLSLINDFNQLLLQNPFSGLITTVPAYTTLTVFFDPLCVMLSDLPGEVCFEKVSAHLNKIAQIEREKSNAIASQLVIPVCYGGDFGPDLLTVTRASNLTKTEVIDIHTAGQYTIFMIGFVPGFAYMGGMDTRLSTPRKEVPNAKIPAGSVGIAGNQTGVYPMETPGGWQIIGRTPLKMFDVNRSQPSLLKGGDRITFKAINRSEFNAYVEYKYENQHH